RVFHWYGLDMGSVIKLRRSRRRVRQRVGLIGGGLIVCIVAVVGFASSLLGGASKPQEFLAASQASPVTHLRMCNKGEKNTSTKTCIVDGDTLWIQGIDYRMQGYDTPETQTNICGGAAEVALGHRASGRFLQLLNGNVWTIETFGSDSTGRRTVARQPSCPVPTTTLSGFEAAGGWRLV
ncbi:MAG: hypothetical protein ABI398_13960, partial [Devosia sp.]